jgi:predicted oxidoreductase
MLGGELEVRRLGFGAMRVVDDREEGVRVVRRAVELGVNFIDTADIYGAGRSEELVAEALHPIPTGSSSRRRAASAGDCRIGFATGGRSTCVKRATRACGG